MGRIEQLIYLRVDPLEPLAVLSQSVRVVEVCHVVDPNESALVAQLDQSLLTDHFHLAQSNTKGWLAIRLLKRHLA